MKFKLREQWYCVHTQGALAEIKIMFYKVSKKYSLCAPDTISEITSRSVIALSHVVVICRNVSWQWNFDKEIGNP